MENESETSDAVAAAVYFSIIFIYLWKSPESMVQIFDRISPLFPSCDAVLGPESRRRRHYPTLHSRRRVFIV